MRVRRYVVAFALISLAVATAAQGAPATGASTEWQVVRSPGGHAAVLSALSFNSPSDGWAAGSTGESLTQQGVDPLVEHWDGSRWSVVKTPGAPQSDEALTGVASAGPSDAWAVGWQDPYGTGRIRALLLHWDGQAWSTAQGPTGAGIVSSLAIVGPADVWAAGAGVIEHFDGSQWSVVKPPRHQFNALGMTAIASDDVWLVGTRPTHGTGYRHGVPYTAHWDGTAWSSVAVPNRVDGARLSSVSAAGSGDVWAVGLNGSDAPLALHFDGASWNAVAVPGGVDDSMLSGVSVAAGKDVWAVGSQGGHLRNGFAVERTFTVHWDGTAWSIVDSKNDTRHDNMLNATTAFTDVVWAVGRDGGTLIERR